VLAANSLDKLARFSRNSLDMKTSIPAALITLALACFALLTKAHGVLPPPDGGYPNFTTAEGTKALFSLTTGSANTAVGWYSLFGTSSGSFNTAVGAGALDLNTADNNTAVGVAALLLNTTGTSNTANGVATLVFNNTGEENTATGAFALNNNTIGDFNTADGAFALWVNTIGERNTATGDSAMFSNTTGSRNTATGNAALGQNTTGHDNTAMGSSALATNNTGADNTAVGTNALLNDTGSGNIALGSGAGSDHTSDFNNIDIGNIGHGGESGVIRIGTGGTQTSALIAGIFGVGFGTDPVFVSSNGQLGVGVSSARFKTEIKPMDKVSEAILALKPVTFRYKQEMDPRAMLRFGLVAEEVAEVNPDLVGRDAKGQVQTVHYEAVNAMLLNEFLKEHRKVEQLEKQVEALTAGLQKVSAQLAAASPSGGGLEASKPAPQMVNNQ
jgi:hypothetical protein